MAALDELNPMGEDYLDKLEDIRGAVAHHVAGEEGEYFLKLKQTADGVPSSELTRRYKAEFDRYMGEEDKRRLAARTRCIAGSPSGARLVVGTTLAELGRGAGAP